MKLSKLARLIGTGRPGQTPASFIGKGKEYVRQFLLIMLVLLLIGALLVFGAIYYKTSKTRLDAVVSRWRLKLSQWQ